MPNAGRKHNYKRRRKNKRNHFNRILSKTILAFIIAITAGCILRRPVMSRYYQWKIDQPKPSQENVILSGISIDGKDVSGMSYEEAITHINSQVDTNTEGNIITIKSSDGKHTYNYTFQDFELKFDIENAVNQAINFGKDSTSPDWWRQFKALEAGRVDFAIMSYNKAQVRSFVNAISDKITVQAKNAGLKRENGQFVVTPAQTGYAIDKEAILLQVYDLIDKREFGKEVNFDIKVTEPTHKDADVSGITGIIGTYSSPYTGGDDNRIQNLRNGCAKINEVVVYPGEEFSTNDHFNPCTEANGWASAGTIVNGKIEDSIGGGMCQVSSALYMALLNAEVKITERYNHSMKVGYADYGFDATLAGDYKDLKFLNDTGCAIFIESYLANSNVVVNIYGKEIHSQGRTLKFYNKFIKETEPDEPITKEDDTLPAGTTKIDMTAKKGYVYELYKEVYENGVLKDTVKINTSTYLPRRQVTLVGTKPVEETT
ncbi:MAG: VanW family protein [Clostridia bacterium]|nr:VanW family protein [Clostridia bacterium]